jgi:hypothetical protein
MKNPGIKIKLDSIKWRKGTKRAGACGLKRRGWNKIAAIGYNATMKFTTALLLFLLASACAAQQSTAEFLAVSADAPVKSVSARQPILLELFTSEGCASCPPAEKNLAYLQNEQPFGGAEIITLAFHVDYWDGLGWKDPFASALFTQRQRVYDRKFRTGSIYTPQMVVDGDIEFVGSKLDKAEKAITRSVSNDKAQVGLSVENGKLLIRISEIPEIEMASVYLAMAEDGLGSDVRRGENAGKRLAHVAVTRSLTGVGRIEAGSREFKVDVPILIEQDWRSENLKAVVFIQENHTRKVYGVGSVRIVQ